MAVFPKSPEGAYSQDWLAGASYALRLYGEGGELLLEREGVLPEPDVKERGRSALSPFGVA